jgi:hypothetical protein
MIIPANIEAAGEQGLFFTVQRAFRSLAWQDALSMILSGIFTLARNQGVLDLPNPIPGTMIPKKAAVSPDMHAVTPEEVIAILDALENAKLEGRKVSRELRLKAQAAVALHASPGRNPAKNRLPS